ncbi:outer membrane protein assembly factor BamA [Halopseudomonas aestusnigri]|uniref:outer membrane protein assembly factor BamA n=1 Tax=Halopseudomonas TaxID=2901189 RepID=UPI000C3D4D56|nr:outer membrane protein assembly factor BamA [Halopseudomonas aestusnigri]MAD27180.1 outer membrane protein assembly factor BamA [Pseudomonadales bacterium]MEE2799376.1 outer membrane protein assembly factor BamA [Pseudomonadota bacterium]HBT56342.1 outer membrane protein assembly factor BamA [Pseudomonas sp.]MAK72540.1 outer membrane protein assembly factor BamA [Pseudomonadales bacterium]MCC4259462.1 outer membrane protein assembly factor BamA [Halopseudomonas aestusnigri]
MKRYLLPALFSMLLAPGAHAAAFQISDIRVNGLQRVSAGSVFSALPLNIGDEVDDPELVEATRSLFRTGFFQDIQLGREGDVLVINLVERPSISSIELEGNKAIKSEDLLKGLSAAGLAEGEIFQRATLEGVRNELLRQYVSQGRYSADIEAQVIPEPRNRVALKIVIDEGSVAAISHINVVGNTVFETEDLVDLFELKTSGWFSFLSSDDKYSREKLSGDLERLRSYYLDRGYINMNVASTQVSITPDKKHVYITVNITEGERYSISDVRLSGDLVVGEDEIKRLMLIEPGQIFSRQVMTSTSDLISRRLGNEGYTFASVNGIPEINEEDKTVAVTFYVDPGKRAYVNRINFRGNTKTEDQVLRREMRQMEGGWASTYLIDQSKTRLERLGFFKEVNVETVPVPGTDDLIDVNYSVEEQPSGSVTASLGFSQSSGIILGGSISQNNFFGTGNRVSVGANRSDYQTSLSFGFLDPYFTVDGMSLGYNAFYRTTDYDELDVDVTSYAVDSFGGGFNFGYPVSDTSRISFGMSAQQDTIKSGIYTVQEILNFLDTEGDSFTNLFFDASWSQSTLNRGVFPDRGHSQSLSWHVTVPGSDLQFYTMDYRGQRFFPMTEDLTLRLHTDLGFGRGFGGTDRMPFYEHYYAGGIGSVRGFEGSTLGPKSTPNVNDPDQDSLPFGGNIKITGGAEVIFPAPFVKDQRSLRTALFFDVGNIYDTQCTQTKTVEGDKNPGCGDVDLGELRYSVGVGLSWLTALGPLGFSLAMPLNADSADDAQVFQFTLGQTF